MNATQLIQQMKTGAELSGGEKILGGLTVTLLAMVIVFLVLIVLMSAIKLMGKVLSRTNKQPEKVAPAAAPIAAAEVIEEDDDEEIAAVIGAVVAMMSAGGQGALTVRKITRVEGQRPNWAVSGSQDAMRPLQ